MAYYDWKTVTSIYPITVRRHNIQNSQCTEEGLTPSVFGWKWPIAAIVTGHIVHCRTFVRTVSFRYRYIRLEGREIRCEKLPLAYAHYRYIKRPVSRWSALTYLFVNPQFFAIFSISIAWIAFSAATRLRLRVKRLGIFSINRKNAVKTVWVHSVLLSNLKKHAKAWSPTGPPRFIEKIPMDAKI